MVSFGLNGFLLASITQDKIDCDLGDANVCNNLGSMYDEGIGIKQDDFQAIKYYQKACDLGEGSGCNNLGLKYDEGEGVRQDDFKALEYLGKGCNLKSSVACKNYARLKKILKEL